MFCVNFFYYDRFPFYEGWRAFYLDCWEANKYIRNDLFLIMFLLISLLVVCSSVFVIINFCFICLFILSWYCICSIIFHAVPFFFCFLFLTVLHLQLFRFSSSLCIVLYAEASLMSTGKMFAKMSECLPYMLPLLFFFPNEYQQLQSLASNSLPSLMF